MAHEVETMAYANETPWHGLGFAVSNDLTTDEMLVAAGLDWKVERKPTFYKAADGMFASSGYSVLVRDKDQRILTSVTDDWEPVQNHDAFDFFKEYVEAGQMKMETAGSLSGGKNVWALAKVGDTFDAVKNDPVESYLLFSNPHQYGRAVTVLFTPIRVVCNNTLTYALQEFDSGSMKSVGIRSNHRQVFDADKVKQALSLARARMRAYEDQAKLLASKHYDEQSVVDYLKLVFPHHSSFTEISRPAKEAYDSLDTQPGADLAPGTWWNAVNAVTYVADHKLGRSPDSRLNSAWFGINKGRKEKALNLAVHLAEAA